MAASPPDNLPTGAPPNLPTDGGGDAASEGKATISAGPGRAASQKEIAAQNAPQEQSGEESKAETGENGLPQVAPGMDPSDALPNIEDLERRSIFKRIALVVFVVLVLIGLGTGFVAVFNLYFVQEKVIEPPPPPEEPAGIPANQDTDGDGMPDVFEIRYEFDENDPEDARRDADLDRLRNVDEYRLGTDPLNEDTDGDGFSDGREVENGFDPSGDGRLKGVNIGNGSGDDDVQDVFPLDGKWTGSLNGAKIQTKQAFFTFQPNKSFTGAFSVKSGQKTIATDMTGTIVYENASRAFSATAKGTLIEDREVDTYTATFEGKLNKDLDKIDGTWTLVPKDESIIKQDRGTFGIELSGSSSK